jgi:hypothetical protein
VQTATRDSMINVLFPDFSSESSVREAFAALVLVGVITGCATTREPYPIAPIRITAGPQPKVAKPVAFSHGKAFRETTHTLEPYANQLYLPLKTGEASDRALRAAYERVFDSAREVASREALSAAAAPGSSLALIEPRGVQLDYFDGSGRGRGPFYARVGYRFSFSDPTGAPIADWRVSGFAQHDSSGGFRWSDEFQIFAEAPRRAMEVAVANFMRSFERVPELIRWGRNLPVMESNAPASGQVMREIAGDDAGVEARYPGVLRLQVRRVPLPKPPAELVKEEATAPALLALRLILRNESPRRLSLDPDEMEWVLAGAKTLEPLPAPMVSEALSGRPFGVAVGVMSPGVGMLPGLFAALATASSVSERKQQFAAWMAATSREILKDVVTPAGGSGGGVIYLAQPRDREGGELIVRVIDLDDAVRYSVRLPLPAR